MTNNKSFFQKLSDSLTSLFPFNSTRTTSNEPQVSLVRNMSPIRFPPNRRVASEAFGKDDEQIKIKRAKLHHDPLDLPNSRIMKPPLAQLTDKFINCNNFNDTASDFSEASNVSVSTSGVSSLHPRSNKRINLSHSEDITLQTRKYPRNLNLTHQEVSSVVNKSFKTTHDFMSSPARKILEKLERLTTPITAGNKLTSYVQRENYLNQSKPSPYSRAKPPIYGRKPTPLKAVTVSASSRDVIDSFGGPIRGKKPNQMKRLGYSDMVDLDSNATGAVCPSLFESGQLNFSNIPLLTISQGTNTDDSFLGRSSPPLEFSFRAPKSIDDPEHHESTEQSADKPPKYHLKSRITQEELQSKDRQSNVRFDKNRSLWKCNTCLSENTEDRSACEGCGVLASQNDNNITVSNKMSPANLDKRELVKRFLENDNSSSNTKGPVLTDSQKRPLFTNSSVTTSSQGLLGNATVTTDSRLSLFPGASTSIGTISEPKTSLFPDVKTSVSTISTSSEPKLFSFGSYQAKTISTPAESISSTPGTSTSTTPAIFNTENKPMSISSPIVFSAASTSNSTPLTTQIPTVSLSAVSKPLTSGTLTTTSISPSTDPKPFTFSSIPATVTTSSTYSNVSTTGSISCSSTAPTFSFMSVSSATTSLTSSSEASSLFGVSKPFTFGQQTATSDASNTIGTKPQMVFGAVTTETTISSKQDIFGASSATVNSKPDFFGASSTTVSAKSDLFGLSSAAVATKPVLFGASSTAVSAKPDLFGSSSTAVTSKPDLFGASLTAIPAKPDLFGATQIESSSTTDSKPMTLFGQSATATLDSKPFTFGQAQSTSTAGATSAVTSKPTTLFGASNGFSATVTSTLPAQTQSSVFTFGAKPMTSEQPPAVTSSNVTAASGLFQFGAPTQPSRPESLSTSTSSVSLFGAVPPQSSSTNMFGAPVATAQHNELGVSKASAPSFNFSTNAPTVSMATPQFVAYSTFSSTPSSSVSAQRASTLLFGQTPSVSQAAMPAAGTTNLFGAPTSQSVANAFNQPVVPQPGAFQFGAANAPVVACNSTNVNSSMPQAAFDFQFGANNALVSNSNTTAPTANMFDFKSTAGPAFQFGASSGGTVNNGSVYSFGGGSGGTGNPDAGGQMMARRTLKVRRKR